MFDLAVSPDGSTLIASMAEISGKQKLVKMDQKALLQGDPSHEVLFDLDADERLHAALRFRHWGWHLSATYNRADFFDLFGPTKTSRRGYSLALQYQEMKKEMDP